MTFRNQARRQDIDEVAVERVVNGDRGRIVLNPAERVEAVRLLTARDHDISDYRIADLIGCGAPTVRRIRAQLAQEAHA